MQILNHKNGSLSVCQKFFIEKSLELLYIGSIDSYRVKLNNSRSILAEIKYCLEEHDAGRIKHFHTIKAKEKEKSTIINEALSLLKSGETYLIFTSISLDYLTQLFEQINEHNYRRVIRGLEILLHENSNYMGSVLDGLKLLIAANNYDLSQLEKIDRALSFLYSELISTGYSKGFLYKLVYAIFVNSLGDEQSFDEHFSNFLQRISTNSSSYEVVFRIDTTQKVYNSISALSHPGISLYPNINHVRSLSNSLHQVEMISFNATARNRQFLSCTVFATDYLAALKKARSTLSEYLDVINLGLSDEFLQIHQRVLVIDSRSPDRGAFQNNVNILDGKYKVEKNHYLNFTRKLPAIIANTGVSDESKEKIKSAIRYLRLGNQSTEVEHKFINYWIGLEYLFSNYESQNTINRIKDHFINAHALAYVKRNVLALKKAFTHISTERQALVPAYNPTNDDFLKQEALYNEMGQNLICEHSLLAYRALKLKKWFFEDNPPKATKYLKAHMSNLEIHFTRIYRLRNEIIHDAATNTNNEQITSNLRYYLTFILNELIDFLARTAGEKNSIEDYFLLNEIRIGNIERKGFLLSDLLDVECSIDFMY